MAPGQLEAEESGLYTLGKYAAYARHCGHHSLAKELQSRYGDLEDFKSGRRQHDLQKYDYVRLPCGRVEDALVDFLEEVKAEDAK
ncbi:hypothetical protein [Denitrobaculum tricleocarpae]|nr:hypothetical protein [Denitrobaculum tricleocarpae]